MSFYSNIIACVIIVFKCVFKLGYDNAWHYSIILTIKIILDQMASLSHFIIVLHLEQIVIKNLSTTLVKA